MVVNREIYILWYLLNIGFEKRFKKTEKKLFFFKDHVFPGSQFQNFVVS